jgi:[acyl-carrier-protein] S-malonyltransferase
MGKTAFLFPGQGAQYIGMGKDFYEQIPKARKIFDLAGEVTGLDLPALCFEENEKLSVTRYTQIAMLTVSAAILASLWEEGAVSDINAGLSLGEYGALLASGVLDMADAFHLVERRGLYMEEAVPCGGAMAAVLGLSIDQIQKICEETSGMVSVANDNCPGQAVITGEENAVCEAGEALKKAGAKRVLPLNVSGPFHSPMLFAAGEKLGKELEKMKFHSIAIPYIANVTADYVRHTEEIKELLKIQVSSPVRFRESLERMIRDGVDTFVEIGPGKTLTGFLKKIDRNVKGMNIQTVEDFRKYLSMRGEQ